MSKTVAALVQQMERRARLRKIMATMDDEDERKAALPGKPSSRACILLWHHTALPHDNFLHLLAPKSASLPMSQRACTLLHILHACAAHNLL